MICHTERRPLNKQKTTNHNKHIQKTHTQAYSTPKTHNTPKQKQQTNKYYKKREKNNQPKKNTHYRIGHTERNSPQQNDNTQT